MGLTQSVDTIWIFVSIILTLVMLGVTYYVAERYYGTGILWVIIVWFTNIFGFLVFVAIHTYYQRNTVKSKRELQEELLDERSNILFNFYTIKDERLFDVGRVDYEIEQLIKNKNLQAALDLASEKYKSNDCDFQLIRAYIAVLKDEIENTKPREQRDEDWY